MTRTAIFAAAAAALALVALVANRRPTPSFEPRASASAGDTLRLTAKTSHPWLTAGKTESFVDVEVFAPEPAGPKRRTPVNMALVIDCSGSMSGDKLNQARRAADALINALTEADTL